MVAVAGLVLLFAVAVGAIAGSSVLAGAAFSLVPQAANKAAEASRASNK